MNAFLIHAEFFGRVISNVALNALWEDVAILLVLCAVFRAFPRASAATRYAAWLVTLCAALVVPVVTSLPRPADPPRAVHASARITRVAEPVAMPATTVTNGRSASRAPARVASFELPTLERPTFTIAGLPALLVTSAWALCVIALLLRLGAGIVRLERLKARALPLAVDRRETLAECISSLVPNNVRLCVSDDIEVPVAVGLFDAMVLLPKSLFDSMSPEDVGQIVLHEVAHLRRRDDWSNLLQRVLAAVLFFSPAVYAMTRWLDLEREAACDDDVLARTGAVRSYAECLRKMAELVGWPHRPLVAPGVFANRRGISERIERLLRAGKNAARGVSLTPAAIVLAATAALAIVLETVAVTFAAPATPSASPAPVPRVTHVHVPATHIHVRATHVEVPATHVYVPAVNVHVPAMNVDVPGVNMTVPAINVNVPAMDIPIASMPDRHSLACTSACDFSGVNWSGRDLRNRSYSAADFSGATLERVNFSHGRFAAVDFSRADLRGASFANARITFADFENARLDGADFDGARIEACDFEGASLTGVDLSRAHLGALCNPRDNR